MTEATIAELTASLEKSGAELSRLLRSVADRQDDRQDPQHWSFREVAAHLEACQVECVLVRIRQIAASFSLLGTHYFKHGHGDDNDEHSDD